MTQSHITTPPLAHFVTFYQAARLLNFSRAAEVLGSDQPSVSRRLKELERQMGQQLFIRGARGVTLTPAGEKLLELVAASVESFLRLPHLFAEEMAAAAPTQVRVAGGQQLLLSLLAPALFAFREHHPGVNVSVVSALKPEVVELVRSGRADVGLTSAASIPGDLAYDEVLRDTLGLFVHDGHSLSGRPVVGLAEIEPFPLLLPDVHSSTRVLLEEAFRSRGLVPKVGMDLQRWEVIREFVALGLGIAVVPSFVAVGLSGVSVVPIDHPFPTRSYGVLTSRLRHKTRPVRELIAAIGEQARTSSGDQALRST
ncbi:MAG: LysR family transcriptional regulator [Dehalococcoidia bacterium]